MKKERLIKTSFLLRTGSNNVYSEKRHLSRWISTIFTFLIFIKLSNWWYWINWIL